MTDLYWHWIAEDRRLQFGEREPVEVGKTLSIVDAPVLCSRGFHASKRALDALQYAPGPIVCRVTLGGQIIENTDKVVAQQRTVVWWTDATATLHEFACRCAETALRTGKVDDQRCWTAIETKRKWLNGEATDDELDAAWAAAWAAARDAAWDAARAAAWDAARAAAWDAAWDAQARQLEDMLLALQPEEVHA